VLLEVDENDQKLLYNFNAYRSHYNFGNGWSGYVSGKSCLIDQLKNIDLYVCLYFILVKKHVKSINIKQYLKIVVFHNILQYIICCFELN
jgi:hypothetical protein